MICGKCAAAAMGTNAMGMLSHSPSCPNQSEWIFTFGFGHVHPVTGESLDSCYVVIPGEWGEARDLMNERFGRQWAFQYPDRESAGVYKYKLREIT